LAPFSKSIADPSILVKPNILIDVPIPHLKKVICLDHNTYNVTESPRDPKDARGQINTVEIVGEEPIELTVAPLDKMLFTYTIDEISSEKNSKLSIIFPENGNTLAIKKLDSFSFVDVNFTAKELKKGDLLGDLIEWFEKALISNLIKPLSIFSRYDASSKDFGNLLHPEARVSEFLELCSIVYDDLTEVIYPTLTIGGKVNIDSLKSPYGQGILIAYGDKEAKADISINHSEGKMQAIILAGGGDSILTINGNSSSYLYYVEKGSMIIKGSSDSEECRIKDGKMTVNGSATGNFVLFDSELCIDGISKANITLQASNLYLHGDYEGCINVYDTPFITGELKSPYKSSIINVNHIRGHGVTIAGKFKGGADLATEGGKVVLLTTNGIKSIKCGAEQTVMYETPEHTQIDITVLAGKTLYWDGSGDVKMHLEEGAHSSVLVSQT
jgi:hypothetical protein